MANRDIPGYISWRRMRQRLNHRAGYEHLDVDPRWHDFKVFIADIGERPKGLTLERKDNTKGYWPWNCVWATVADQASNRRNASPLGRNIILEGRSFRLEIRRFGYRKSFKTLEEAVTKRDELLALEKGLSR